MDKNIEQLLTLVAETNDLLIEKYPELSSTVGLLEQSLQASNAVTINNIKRNLKLMFIILDAHPDIVGIGTGEAGTEAFTFIDQSLLSDLTSEVVMQLAEKYIV
ncbi:hypothetical protein [Psychromonas arctica]|uniref:hypothetical protein n=1 Tax=Psychromonas arctica TaxID=168275 RepID=UPI002FCF6E31